MVSRKTRIAAAVLALAAGGAWAHGMGMHAKASDDAGGMRRERGEGHAMGQMGHMGGMGHMGEMMSMHGKHQGMDGAAHRHEGAAKAPKATDPKADAAKP